ncbi:WD repeat-containing protein 76 isoform X2 [Mixophyes fleayi]|uniref:WD repeat-containing protein 76 isoform X2 n=1 Tax=Mixophyes fleayi TaxID=3061075 RepID=UPI003F4DCD4B
MSGRKTLPARRSAARASGRKTPQMPQEATPDNRTVADRTSLHSLTHKVLSPFKMRGLRKRLQLEQEDTPVRKDIVIKQPIVKLPRLEIKPEIQEETQSTEKSDNGQFSDLVNNSAAPLSISLAHNVLLPSNKSPTKNGNKSKRQQKGTSKIKACVSLEASCMRKQPMVKVSRLKLEPKNEEEKDSTNEYGNDQQSIQTASSFRPPPKPQRKREKPQNTDDLVIRRSVRLQRIESSGVKHQVAPEPLQERPMKPPGPVYMVSTNHKHRRTVNAFLRRWTSISQETVITPRKCKDLLSYEANLKALKLRDTAVAKVVPSLIFSVAVHPSKSQILVAAGDKFGHVGLWDLRNKSGDGVYLFAPHSRPVTTLSFSPSNSAHLLSLSYDGTVRCGDFNSFIFDEIYRDEEENFTSFDFLSGDGSVLIVSHYDSQLSVVDRRTPGTTYEMRTSVGMSSVRTVSVHPLRRELCVVAGASDVFIYDVRKLYSKKTHPVMTAPGHTKSVASAYFSPDTGCRILTTCTDGFLRVLNSESLGSSANLLAKVRYIVPTDRCLPRFRAIWDPKKEDCFMVGSMEWPRQIEVFYANGEKVHTLKDTDNLLSLCSINAIHPARDLVAGGNASGRLHVFYK